MANHAPVGTKQPVNPFCRTCGKYGCHDVTHNTFPTEADEVSREDLEAASEVYGKLRAERAKLPSPAEIAAPASRRIDRWTVTIRQIVNVGCVAEVLIWYGFDTSGDAGTGDPSGQRSKSQTFTRPSRLAVIAEVFAFLAAEGA